MSNVLFHRRIEYIEIPGNDERLFLDRWTLLIEGANVQQRLLTAGGTAIVAGLAGAGVALWLKSDQMLGIVIVASLIGFFLGLLFKFRIV
jgi:hypothetical protein